MCQYFGIKPDEEKYIQEVAEMGLCAPLPPGWKEHVQEQEQEPAIAFRYVCVSVCRYVFVLCRVQF
jgi:hypothetical protein